MSRRTLATGFLAMVLGCSAVADTPRVVVDIAPVHSLVARIMDGVGRPDLIIPSNASPHEYNMRPSDAAALQDADLVFWMGPALTPWMEEAIATLAEEATATELLELEATELLEFREGPVFEAHAHDHAEGRKDHDHESHDHESHDHEGHGHEYGDAMESADDDHRHGARDPHAWLSPENAIVWLDAIAATLSEADPQNAGAYRANSLAGRADILDLVMEIEAVLGPVRGGKFIVFHDFAQYFETAFDIPASGSISLSDASDPSPARIAEIRDRIAADGITCVLSEPQFNAGLLDTVMDRTAARTTVIDPLGAGLEPGPDLYPRMMRNIAGALAECLSEPS